jgi:CPA1 family monovalent cation:H+ antiporter
VALLSIAQRLPLPRRVVDLLVGESLVNDATALVALRFALAAVATGSFVAADATVQFFYVVTAAILIGLASAWAIVQLRRFSARHTLYDNLDVFLTPFVAYLAAELCGASGVLAVVVSGLYIGRRIPELMSSQARLQGGALWEMVVFVLNGLIFVLIGLQLNVILAQPLSLPMGTLLAVGAAVTVAVVLTRLVYMFPAVLVPRLLNRTLRERDPAPPLSHIALLGWTGMRGGVSLAAALAIPTVLAGGAPFPGRNEIILITYMVILGTLGLQGLTLPALIRLLGLRVDEAQADEEATARLEVALSAIRRLDELAIVHDVPTDMLDSLHDFYLERAERLQARRAVRPDTRLETRDQLLVLLKSQVLDAERRRLLALRAEGAIGDNVFHRLQEELDRQAVVVASASASPGVIPPG